MRMPQKTRAITSTWITVFVFWMIYFSVLACFNYYTLSLLGREDTALTVRLLLSLVLNILIICTTYYLTVAVGIRFLTEYPHYFKALLGLRW